jgi:hypothetical protein
MAANQCRLALAPVDSTTRAMIGRRLWCPRLPSIGRGPPFSNTVDSVCLGTDTQRGGRLSTVVCVLRRGLHDSMITGPNRVPHELTHRVEMELERDVRAVFRGP